MYSGNSNEAVNLKLKSMLVSASTIQDVKIAFEFGKTRLPMHEQLAGDWIYSVDSETMGEVKRVYKEATYNCSLYDIFCKILKM